MSTPIQEDEKIPPQQTAEANEPPVGGQNVPVTAEDKPADTTNAISTEKELEENQQHSSINPNAAENGQPVYTTQNPLLAPHTNQPQTQSLSVQDTQSTQENRSNPQAETSQQPISATTSAGITAPKPKADFAATDATIQGLLLQVVALQHNKIQQITNAEQQ